MQASAVVPMSPFNKDPRAAPSQAILEQQMSQRLSLEPRHVSRTFCLASINGWRSDV